VVLQQVTTKVNKKTSNRWQTRAIWRLCKRSVTIPSLSTPEGVPRRQPHRRSGLATLPSVGAVP